MPEKINCDIDKCKSFARNNRGSENENKQREGEKDENDALEYYIDLLDNIHCYFLHSY